MTAKGIKDLRMKLGLTQKGLSLALGCSVYAIEHYEQGARAPSEVFLERLERLERKAAKLDSPAKAK